MLYRDYNHRGRVTIERVREVLPSNNFRFYVCGPGAMMESLVPALWEWGVPESHVHFEAFGPASVSGVRADTRASSRSRAKCGSSGAIARRRGTVRSRRSWSLARRRA